MFNKQKKLEMKAEATAMVGDAIGDIATSPADEREHGVRMLIYTILTKTPDSDTCNTLLMVGTRFAKRLDPKQFPDHVLERLFEEEQQEVKKRHG